MSAKLAPGTEVRVVGGSSFDGALGVVVRYDYEKGYPYVVRLTTIAIGEVRFKRYELEVVK